MFLKAYITSCITTLAMLIALNGSGLNSGAEVDTICLKAMHLNEASQKLRNQDRAAAMTYAKEALQIATSGNCKEMKALSLKNIGAIYFLTGSYELALTNYNQALDIYEAMGNQTGISACNHNIAYVYEKLSNFDFARRHYAKSLEMDKALGDLAGVAATLNNISILHFHEGHLNLALEMMMQALQISRNIKDPEVEADCLMNIGSVLETQKQYEQAILKYQEAMHVYQVLGDDYRVSVLQYNMGRIRLEQNNLDEAMFLFNESLIKKIELEDYVGIALCLSNAGTCLQRSGQHEKAIDYFLQALKVDYELGNHRGVATQLSQIGSNLLIKNEPSQALNYLHRSQEIAKTYNYAEIIKDNYLLLMNANIALSNYETSYEYLQKYSALADSMRLDTLLYNQLANLANPVQRLLSTNRISGIITWKNLLFMSTIINILLILILVFRRFKPLSKTSEVIEDIQVLDDNCQPGRF